MADGDRQVKAGEMVGGRVLIGATVPVHARHDQAVAIHWRLTNGRELVEQRTVPPKPTQEALLEGK